MKVGEPGELRFALRIGSTGEFDRPVGNRSRRVRIEKGVHPDERRLPALLKESRKFQNEASTKLSGQVLEALWELLRGFQRANEETSGRLLAEVVAVEARLGS